ncbi:site-specific DNA-methyltransferase [Pseudonocardia parietis]|uniref:16S rRNA G966 N2-methylase RsmD n=1 Tax=Pseudonocardia parietis TaxID=570936 RepID=A0ABS4W0I4_9PSEU|nr:site-specific DNA-methyltransferase [Pseudonocardia parietis]MBP2369717.1 16S rRNA G966 N2-methylase RsmD [Pseudonocardia parietis]
MARHTGRLELTWTDKDKALLSTGDGKYDYTFASRNDPRVREVRLLHEVDRVESSASREPADESPESTAENLLITGDAMHALDALAKTPEWANQFLGKVTVAYIDPPFNTGQAFDNYEDNIEHSIWLTLLRDRLRQIKPLLADDGSVWVHLDDVEVHRCRVVMDEVLGSENFVAEVVWQKADSTRNDAKLLSVDHDTILVYRASPSWRPNRLPRTSDSDARFSSPDHDLKPWFDDNPTAPGANSHQGMVYAIQHPITGELQYPARGRCWWTEQKQILRYMNEYAAYELRDIRDAAKRADLCGTEVDEVRHDVRAVMLAVPLDRAQVSARERYSAGTWPMIVLRSGGTGGLGRKAYVPDTGLVASTWWSNDLVGHNREAKAEIKALFPEVNAFATPKPERLLQRVIQIASNPGDLVLDCFAGSGTTAAVAHKMGRRWVTCELLPETVATFTKPRLTRVVMGNDRGGVTNQRERVPDSEQGLPEGMTPEEARNFVRLLGKFAKMRADLDSSTLKALRTSAKTKEIVTSTWHGGGAFSHLVVGPSMYEFDAEEDEVFLAETATNGVWSKSVAAQLKFALTPEHPVFCGVRGRQRLSVVDGVVDDVVVRTILEHLGEKERVVIVAKVVLPEAEALLNDLSPGSRIKKAPRDLFQRKTVK